MVGTGNGGLAANLTSGMVIAILNVTNAISMAALMFAGLSPDLFVLGVTIVLLSTVLCAFAGAVWSGFGQVVLAPRSGLAPIYATMVAAIVGKMSVDDAAMAPTLIATIMTGTIVTGLFLFLVGQFRLGNLIRYIPYPVMAGFFAGIGLLFMMGGLTVASGVSVNVANIAALFSGGALILCLPAIALGLTLYVVTLRIEHWAVIPLALVGAGLTFYLLWFLPGGSTEGAIEAGWLPQASEASISLPIISLPDFALVNWSLVFGQWGAMASLAMLATIILLVDTSGIEMIAEKELDHDRELKVAGVTNFVNGALGGYVGVQTASDTAMAVKLGANSRLFGLVYTAGVAAVMAVGTTVISVIPSFVLGGLLFSLGLDFLVTWAWSKRKDFPTQDFVIVLLILAIIAVIGLLEGIAIGFLIAMFLFVVSYSRLSVLKSELGGDAHDSIVIRNAEARAYLNDHSRSIWIMRLQGFLFFGTADRLFRLVQERVKAFGDDKMRFLVVDFENVSALDTSAVQTFVKLRKYADRQDFALVMTGLDRRSATRLRKACYEDGGEGAFHDTLEDGVAWCETELLKEFHAGRRAAGDDLRHILGMMTGQDAAAEVLAPYFTRVEQPAGSYLFREGDESTSLYILSSGVASVIIHPETEEQRIIRIFEEGTVLGEMALFTGQPRSAAVHVDREAVFYRLTKTAFSEAQAADPLAAGLFQSYIVRLLADRLERANRENETLR